MRDIEATIQDDSPCDNNDGHPEFPIESQSQKNH